MVLPMLSQKLIRWLLLAAFLAQGWGWQPAIARTLASPVADRLAQTPPSTSVAVPKWLSAPTLDGQCSDAAYSEGATVPLLATLTGGGVNAHLVHSGIDFYLCLNNLPFHAGATVAMQVDSDNSRAAQPQPGDYKFSISSSGAISVTEGDGAGNFVTLPTANTAVSVTKSIDGRLWNLELQVGLEWLGGYARTDGLSLAFLDGAATLRWPLDHALNAPATWGTLTLTPLYPDGVNAGSAFIDGLGGYLVIPYAPALNPTELTIEAWVKVVDGACGTLVGNDQATAYWLALCQAIQFSTAGINTVRGGQRPLTDGWHHVAVTMDADGLRSYYLDGQLDTQYGWHPAEEERTGEPEVVEKLGVAKTMLRIGSDRTADSADSSWHGYVQDLRIWNVPRTQAEIQATIFASPSPTATGLLAWWPFASGLQDVAGGHHAGLVGNAALAHATRDITSFPAPVTPDPILAWDAHIPTATIPISITLDGVCRPDEYPADSRVVLEPNRAMQMNMVLGDDELYLCTNILFGRPSPDDALQLFFDRNGNGGQALDAGDLRLRLTPDGKMTVGDGNAATGFANVLAAADLVESKLISATKYSLQEDLHTIDEAWWAAELRIPFTTLAPYRPTAPLHFALRYDGTVADTTTGNLPWPQLLHGSWPATFDANKPVTWGTGNPNLPPLGSQLYLPLIVRAGATGADSTAYGTAQRTERVLLRLDEAELLPSATNNHGAPPSVDNFNAACPESGIIGYGTNHVAKWPSVDEAKHPIVRGEGIIQHIEVSNWDSPFYHNSHDVDMQITPDAASAWIMISGNPGLVLETESAGFPIKVRPQPGDHVTAVGRWIYDCGHEPKTEIHPLPIFESDGLSMQTIVPARAGKPPKLMQQVRTVRIAMNSDPGPYYSYTFSGAYNFKVQMPAGAKSYGDGDLHPFVHVVEGDASKVSVTVNGSEATVTVTPPTTGKLYWELTLGWLDQQYGPFIYDNAVYRVHLDQIDILDDHDHGFPDCAIDEDCGEWSMTASVNHVGQQVFWNKSVDEDDPALNTNLAPCNVVDHLNLTVEGHDDDDPLKGDLITDLINKDLGSLASLCCGTTHTLQPGSDWKLFYRVTQDGVIPLVQQDEAFWGPRWADEANDETPYGPKSLGELSVPGQGQPAATTNYSSFVSETPLKHDNTTLLGADVDRYHFTLADFADVSFGNLPAGLTLQIDSKDPWYNWSVPANIQAMLGYKGAIVKVLSTNGKAGDQAYTVQINRTFRSLPNDWGEAQDAPASGRLVDLVTPEAGTDVYPPGQETPASRRREKDWAWQHVANDVDDYDILIPPVTPRPAGQPVCEFDTEGGLFIEGYGARLRIPAKNLDANNTLALTNLNAQFPTGHVHVTVEKLANEGRGVYHLVAEWNDGRYFNADQCALLRAIHAIEDRVSGMNTGPIIGIWQSGAGPDLVNPAPFVEILNVSKLGGYQPFNLAYGTGLDVHIASPAQTPVVARLFDKNGVLVSESALLNESASQQAPTPATLEPQGRLKAGGLTTGETYLMQFVSTTNLGGGGAQPTKIGVAVATQP